MNHLIVTLFKTPADLVMLEPTLEGLYYKHAPARILLRTTEECAPILKNHPLVAEILVDHDYHLGLTMGHFGHRISETEASLFFTRAKLRQEFDPKDSFFHFDFTGIWKPYQTSLVDAFPVHADVKLLRRTPSLGNYRHTIGMKQKIAYIDASAAIELPLKEIEAAGYTLSFGWKNTSTEARIQQIGEAEIYIGDTLTGMHLAHALGVRKIIALYMDELPVSRQASYPNVREIYYKENSSVYQQEIRSQVEAALVEPKYPHELNKGNACEWIKNLALQYCHGRGLDVGSNRAEWALPGAIPSDHESRRFSEGPFDYIFSSHCLEHITEWKEELKIWYDSLKKGGTVFIYVPHPAMEHWQPEGDWVKGGWHVWSPEPVELVKHLQEQVGFTVQAYSTYPDHAWGFWVAARKF